MSTHLCQIEVESFRKRGYLGARRVLSEAEALRCRRALEAFEAIRRDGDRPPPLTDLHLLFRWAWNLAHDARIVNPVTDLLGPNVLLWGLNWFIKEARDGKFVTWHQDATYWGLEPHDVVTAWVALSDAGPATGPMKFIPGSHKGPILQHANTWEDDNLLTRGQMVEDAIDESSAMPAPLAVGEMSLHHVRTVHGSTPNMTDDRRIGLVLRYCATHVRQVKIPRDTATLVAGEDAYGHFDLMQAPERDMGEREMARHRDSVVRTSRAIMG